LRKDPRFTISPSTDKLSRAVNSPVGRGLTSKCRESISIEEVPWKQGRSMEYLGGR
jgi:hypothetical protein